jgi:PAS domain S-box-containing protein
MHGYDSVEEFQNVRVADLYQQPDQRKEFVAELLRQGSVVNYELRLKKRDGTAIYGSINATVHHGPGGEVDWIDGMLEDVTERKQAEQALRASEERYRALAESSPDAIFILDRDIKVQYANPMAAELWRRPPEELIGLTQRELFPPEVAQYHCKVVAEVFETGKPVRRDEPLALPTGEQWIEIRLAPLFGEQGRVTSVMGIWHDITERKRAERQLAEALDLNQKMIAASAMGIAAFRASGECVFANKALARIVGGSVGKLLEDNFRRLESWQKSGLLQLAEEALSQGQARLGEVCITTRFGKTIWLDCHAAPFVSKDQPHLLIMVLDITERKRAEGALKQAERLQRAILDNIPNPAWLKDAQGRFLACNQALATFYGRPVEAIVGKTVLDCLPAEGARATQEDKEVITTRRSLLVEAPLPDAQGRVRWFETIKSPLFNERDEVIGTVGIARDVTERHRLERQILEISDREQARIGQDIHDGLCQQLVSLAFDANSLHSALSIQRRPEAKKARRIARFLDQAITESRQLSRGLFPVRLETEGLPPALEELARATSARSKIRCRFNSQGPVAVKNIAIATHLYRIAQEALANVVKHSGAGKVSIRLKTGASQIELRVEDNGAGLSPAKRKKATGLGLHIMDYRARAVGGTLHIGPGRRGGTIISCCVPRPRS